MNYATGKCSYANKLATEEIRLLTSSCENPRVISRYQIT